MAEKNQNQPPKQESDIVECRLMNPTIADRVIYDGFTRPPKSIRVGRGQTVQARISRKVAEDLRQRNRDRPNSDLRVLPLNAPEDEDKTAA